jgi:hypothetical protein
MPPLTGRRFYFGVTVHPPAGLDIFQAETMLFIGYLRAKALSIVTCGRVAECYFKNTLTNR